MATETTKKSNNTLLYLVLASGAAYFLLGKGTSDPDSWLNTTAATDPSGTGASASMAPTGPAAGLLSTAGATAPATAPTVAPPTSGALVDGYGIAHATAATLNPDLSTPGQPEAFKLIADTYGLYYEEIVRLQDWLYYRSYAGMPYADFVTSLVEATRSGQLLLAMAGYNAANGTQLIKPRK